MSIIRRTGRYALVGLACAVANNVIMIGGSFAGLHYAVLTLVAFVLVTPMAYALHCRHTFKQEPSFAGLFRFVSGVALGFPLSLALMALFCSGLRLPMVVAAPVTTVLLFLFNYLSAQWSITRRLRVT